MLRVTVELVPFGQEEHKRTIAHAIIYNDRSGSPSIGNYRYKLYNEGRRMFREGEVKGFRRKDFTVWWLVALVLRLALPDWKKTIIE